MHRPKTQRKVVIKGVRREEIDGKKLAYVFWEMARAEARRRREAGEPPRRMSAERRAELVKQNPELGKLFKQIEKLQARLEKDLAASKSETWPALQPKLPIDPVDPGELPPLLDGAPPAQLGP